MVYSLFFSVLAWYPISYSWDVATPLLSCLWKFILGDLAEWQKDSWWSEQTLFEFKTGMGQKVGSWIRRLAHDVITRGSHTILSWFWTDACLWCHESFDYAWRCFLIHTYKGHKGLDQQKTLTKLQTITITVTCPGTCCVALQPECDFKEPWYTQSVKYSVSHFVTSDNRCQSSLRRNSGLLIILISETWLRTNDCLLDALWKYLINSRKHQASFLHASRFWDTAELFRPHPVPPNRTNPWILGSPVSPFHRIKFHGCCKVQGDQGRLCFKRAGQTTDLSKPGWCMVSWYISTRRDFGGS